MNNQEFDFKELAQYELEVAVDQVIEQFGFEAVMEELEKRAFKESAEFFEGIIAKAREWENENE